MEPFVPEELKKLPPCVASFTRTRCSSGWYVRAVFCHEGFGAGAFCESALYFHDPDECWDASKVVWEKIAPEPRGGIYRSVVPGGWILLATAKGETRLPDHEHFETRFGSITFVPEKL
ncbi:MAG TPA: hypothetical protein HPP76_06245 [Desulfuromonadales bacterium]|nr:hypothetical protein [Desulfuromonadales bacterium]